MKIFMFIAATGFFIFLILIVHSRFLGKIKLKPFSDSFDVIPIAELLIVIAYLYWTFYLLFSEKSYYLYLIFGLSALFIVLPLFFILKDFIPGLAFRSDPNLKQGIHVELNNEKAEILKLGRLRMFLKTEQGNTYIIPFSKIRSISFLSADLAKEANYYCFRFAIDEKSNTKMIVDKITSVVLTSPWLPARTTPQIHLLNTPNEESGIEVCFHAMSPKHAGLIEKKIKELVTMID